VSSGDERRALAGQLRQWLVALRDEGLDYLGPRPPRPAGAAAQAARAPAAPPAPRRAATRPAAPPAGWEPRVAALQPGELGEEARAKAQRLQTVRETLGDCTRCALCERRQTIVFGEGNPDAPVVFVGEGPGEEEDRSGRPFVGRAGELLSRMIASVGWRREDVYICNIVKCRPPQNREPRLEEVAMCQPFLDQQILAIRPRALVALGKPASSALLGAPVAITRIRGQWQKWRDIPLMPTFHPAYLLRNYTRETRQAVWEDLKAVRALVDRAQT
jgi:DNA polymerase